MNAIQILASTLALLSVMTALIASGVSLEVFYTSSPLCFWQFWFLPLRWRCSAATCISAPQLTVAIGPFQLRRYDRERPYRSPRWIFRMFN